MQISGPDQRLEREPAQTPPVDSAVAVIFRAIDTLENVIAGLESHLQCVRLPSGAKLPEEKDTPPSQNSPLVGALNSASGRIHRAIDRLRMLISELEV